MKQLRTTIGILGLDILRATSKMTTTTTAEKTIMTTTMNMGRPQGYAPTQRHNVKITTTLLFILLLTTNTNYAWAQIDINNPSNGTGYTWDSPTQTLTINGNNGTYTINGTGEATTNRIVVSSGVTANITLNNVNIDVSSTDEDHAFDVTCAFDMTGAIVNLTLTGTNSLKSGYNRAGIQTTNATININGTGTLTANGGSRGAGIGGSGGTINISGGTVTATGGSYGAGIGGGRFGAGGNISITGGTVTANGGSYGAGIGGGEVGNGGNISITGGTVTANGGRYGAGIGGGDQGNGGSITITGGTIKATGDTGIGDGVYGSGGTLKITGGSINASTNLQPTNGSANVYPNTLTLPDAVNASVTAGAINENSCAETPVPASGVYGIKDVATDESGKLYLYLPNSDENSIELTANGTLYKGTTGSTSTLKPPYAITLDKTGTHTFSAAYGYSAQSVLVTVTNAGSQATGNLTVELSGTNASSFQLSTNSINSILDVNGSANFTVSPNAGLAVGTYNAIVNVAGTNVTTQSFNVSFTVSPRNINSAGITVNITGHTVYTGNQLTPAFTVDDTEATISSADYTVSTWGANIEVSTGGSLTLTGRGNYSGNKTHNFPITKATPTAQLLTFTPTEVVYDELTHEVNVAWADGLVGHGEVTTVYYDGNTNAPSEVGNCTISVDLAAGDNYNAVTSLTLNGTFSIKTEEETTPTPPTPTPPTPTPPTPSLPTPYPDMLNYTIPSDLIYDGKLHPVKVEQKSWVTGLGYPMTVKYNSASNNIPLNAGVYRVSVDIPDGSSYSSVKELWIGSFEIFKQTPDDNCFSYSLAETPIYNGLPQPLKVTLLDTIAGMGTCRVLYDGSLKVPVDTGTYKVTLAIAEGVNYTAADLYLGNYIITPTQHAVQFDTLPKGTTLDLDPDKIHYHDKGNDFTFILSPGKLNYGRKPVVNTVEPLQNPNSWIEIETNTDSTYIVTVHELTENIKININFTQTDGSTTNNNNQHVWSTGKYLCLFSTHNTNAYIYSIAGTLVQITTIQTNQITQITLPTGFYIVTINKHTHKILVTQ